MYGVAMYTVGWNSQRGQRQYLLIYSFSLKSAFDARQLFRR